MGAEWRAERDVFALSVERAGFKIGQSGAGATFLPRSAERERTLRSECLPSVPSINLCSAAPLVLLLISSQLTAVMLGALA